MTTASSTPIRVAHLIQNLNYGGMERVLHSLGSHLPRHGFEVHVVVLQYLGRFAEELEGAVTFHQVPPMGRLSLLHPGALIETLRRVGPQVVHSHSGVWLKASRAARVAGVPVMVHTEHGRPDPVPVADRCIDNIASRMTDQVIAVSEPLAAVLRQQVVHDPGKIRVIQNGVDTERLGRPVDRRALRAELGLPPEGLVIGSIGRLEPVKNYPLALRAFAGLTLPAGIATPRLVLVGDGSERQRLEGEAQRLGIADRVHFLGWRADAERLYPAFDIFSLTSTSEGTSISLLEAMSCGICPVVTDVGGNRAVLGPELTRLLVPSEDPASLTARWAEQLSDPGLRTSLGAQARERVRATFSLEHMVREHADLYRSLVSAAR
jgi:glycosyltransferase involved in cell wall biosynthesis